LSTIDFKTLCGADIPIEQRESNEMEGYQNIKWVPEGVSIRNYAFDVTPAKLVTAYITEKGVLNHQEFSELKNI
jgi:methylthioribose-1-phosphate isomerase